VSSLPSSAAQLVADAAVALSASDWNEAIAAATEAIELESADELMAEAYLIRSIAFGFVNQLNSAADDATRAIDLGLPTSDVVWALLVRANAHRGMGQLEDAVADATEAIDLEDENTGMLAWAYSTRGGSYTEMGRWEDALADTTMAIDLGWREIGARLDRAVSYRELGRFEQALSDATAAINLGVEDVDLLLKLHLVRVETYMDTGQFDEAVKDATAAIDLEPLPGVEAQMLVLRAEAFAELGRLDDATADLQLAMQVSPYADPDVQQVADKFGILGFEPVDHQVDLAAGETPPLAQLLVGVDGYTYVDIRAAEINDHLRLVQEYEDSIGDDLVIGTSWHPVVAQDPSQNTASNAEVGFLMLLQRSPSTDHDQLIDHVQEFWLTGDLLEEFRIDGVDVRIFENPDQPNSRYVYTWETDAISAVLDGADREPIERWLTAYLEVLTSDGS
jgi:tetratricopeptide (TPR) repeat protein